MKLGDKLRKIFIYNAFSKYIEINCLTDAMKLGNKVIKKNKLIANAEDY